METPKDLTSEFRAWLKLASDTLDTAKSSRESERYGDYIADLQESEEKTSKGIIAAFGLIGNSALNVKILEYYKEVSNNSISAAKNGDPRDFTHLWAEKFFEKVLNKETLEIAGLSKDITTAFTKLKSRFVALKKRVTTDEDITSALNISEFFIDFSKHKDLIKYAEGKLQKAVSVDRQRKYIRIAFQKSDAASIA